MKPIIIKKKGVVARIYPGRYRQGRRFTLSWIEGGRRRLRQCSSEEQAREMASPILERLPGLIDPESLYDSNRSGQSANQSGHGRPLVGPLSGGGRTDESCLDTTKHKHPLAKEHFSPQKSQEGVPYFVES